MLQVKKKRRRKEMLQVYAIPDPRLDPIKDIIRPSDNSEYGW